MFKRFISVLCMFFGILTAAHAGPVANIEYVHKMITHVWGLEIPYNPELKNPRFAANMEYLLAAVDVANEILNGYKTTDYKSDPKYATRYIADTLVTNKAVYELIKIYYPFNVRIKTTNDNQPFNFNIAARGKFYVDWGDGNRETIDLTDIDLSNSALSFEHTYSSAGEYTVSLGGRATEYADVDPYSDGLPGAWEHTFNFYPWGDNVVGVSGKIGSVFPTLADGSNPNFGGLFAFSQIETVPADLFDGIYGQASLAMFAGMFMESKIKEIPGGLFDGITGSSSHMFRSFCEGCKNLDTVSGDAFKFANNLEPTHGMFESAFMYSSLKGIPAGLFDDVVGEPAGAMFFYTFDRCSELTGEIPAGLFAGISGTPADSMFRETFNGCSGLTGEIPDDLFGNISGTLPQWSSFGSMFAGCTGLTGMSAKIGGTLLYEIWPDATSNQVGGMYYNCTGLTDYPCIPTTWGGLGTDTDCKIENVIVESTTRPDVAEWPFEMKTVDLDAGGEIGIGLALVGDVYIDWGDGNYTTINMMGDYQAEEIGHEYVTAGEYTIKIAANPRKYFSGMDWTTFYVWPNESLASIDGSLGRVFPTLSNGSNPCFAYAFENAANLTGEIPADLFDGIHGQPNDYMYAGLFAGCSGLTGEIPAGLFGDLSGEWTEYLFDSVFGGCAGLTGEIPADLFAGLTGDLSDYALGYAFADCSGLTGPSAKIGNKYLYEIWPDATEYQVEGMYIGATGLSDWCQIPDLWRGGADLLCDSDAEFAVHVKTPSANSTFEFRLGAAGEFTVDWGDGDVETIVKDNTDSVTYTHTYANAGDYVFGISGQATAYPTDEDGGAAFTFYTNYSNTNQIYNIRGSLGHVFGTLADGSQPRFSNLFHRATNMTIVVPENLFAGIHGQPINNMFEGAFDTAGIVGFAGPLFAGISGTPTDSLYQFTFAYCNELSLPLPDGMFGNLTGDLGNSTFYGTFYQSHNMTGSSARDANGRYLYEVWPDATWDHVTGMYCNDSQYTDRDNIPNAWTSCID